MCYMHMQWMQQGDKASQQCKGKAAVAASLCRAVVVWQLMATALTQATINSIAAAVS